MDKNQEVKPYLRKYKNPEKRKAYLNKINKERYHRLKGLKKIKEDDIMKAEVNIKEESTAAPQKEMGDQAFKQAIEGLKEIGGESTKDDPIFKVLNAVERYGPLVMQFLKGFTDRQAEKQAQQIAINQKQGMTENRRVPAPEGWVYMSPIQRLAKKYLASGEVNPWFTQGQLYESGVVGTHSDIDRAVRSNRPVAMESTIHGQRSAAIQSAEKWQSMADLQKAGEQEKWDKKEDLEKPPQEEMDLSNAKEVPRKDGKPGSINEAIAKKDDQQPVAEAEITDAAELLQDLGGKLMEDNQKYIGMVLEYFKTRPIKKFTEDLKDADKTIKEFIKKWGWAIPFQTREAVKRITFEEIEKMLKEQDPEKHKMIIKKKLRAKFKKLWSELQKQA